MNGSCLWAGGWHVMLGLRPRHQAKLVTIRNRLQPCFPPALVLSGITTLLGPCHFSGIGQFEGSMSFCLYKMLMTQKVSLIHWSQRWGVTKLPCLPWASVDGWIRGGRRGICEGNTFPSHWHPPTSEKVKQLLLSSSLTSFPHEQIPHFLRSCPKM